MENPINASPNPRSEAKSPSPKAGSVFVSEDSTDLPEIKSKTPPKSSSEFDSVAETKPVVKINYEYEDPVIGEWRRGKFLFGKIYMAMVTEPRAPRFKDFPPVMSVKSLSYEPHRVLLENEKLILPRFLGCPNVIQYLGEDEVLDEDGASRLHLFFEFPSGGTLYSLISASEGRLEESVVRRHTCSMLAGLKAIHDEGYVHCNLTAYNIYLVEEGGEMVAKVADFGLMKKAGDQQVCAAGSWAPEGLKLGVQEKPSDIWSLGTIVLGMFGGKIMGLIPSRIPVIPKGISQEAVDFLLKCLATEPEDRPTVDELLAHPFVCPMKIGQRRIMQWKEWLFPFGTTVKEKIC